jgi:DNA-binding PadR family transcriptional regulator
MRLPTGARTLKGVLSLAEWIVLTVVDEGPTHGFAIAALTAEDGAVGRAWHVPRPIVYRSLDRLGTLDLVRVESTEAGHRGPRRSILTSTPAGAQAVGEWLEQPVGHVRDMRSELLVKLALRLRRDLPAGPLVAAQRETVTRVRAAIERQRDAEAGFGRILLTWRYENAAAAERFLDAVTEDAVSKGKGKGEDAVSEEA